MTLVAHVPNVHDAGGQALSWQAVAHGCCAPKHEYLSKVCVCVHAGVSNACGSERLKSCRFRFAQ
jgi:hypothetical protein